MSRDIHVWYEGTLVNSWSAGTRRGRSSLSGLSATDRVWL